ncbi:hypothetical protein D3C76_1702230 [compost metagenome]
MVHVHVGNHHVGHGRKIDTGSLKSFGELSGSRKAGELPSHSSVDEYGLLAATHHKYVQRPIERVRPQEHVFEPSRAGGWVGVGGHCLGRQR